MAPTTAAAMVAAARQRIANLSVDQVAADLARGETLLVDVREPEERAQHGVDSRRASRRPWPDRVLGRSDQSVPPPRVRPEPARDPLQRHGRPLGPGRRGAAAARLHPGRPSGRWTQGLEERRPARRTGSAQQRSRW